MGNQLSDSEQETDYDFDFDLDSMMLSMSIFAAIEKKEMKKTLKLLSENSDYFKHPDRVNQVTFLLVYAAKSDNKKKETVLQLLFSFLKFEVNEKEYIDAIYEGNVQSVKLFLENGMSFEDSEWKQELMVNWIFLRKNIRVRKEMLELHLEYGLDPEYRNSTDGNLLGIFVKHVKADDYDAVEIAEILLNFELTTDDFDKVEFSPLFTAINSQNIQLIKLLIKRGADVNKKSSSLQFPLYIAAKYDNKELFELLLSNGADVTDKDEGGQTALHEACYYTSKQIVSLLIRKGADLSAVNINNKTPLSEFIDFIYQGNDYQQCLLAMLRGFAKQSFENIPVFEADLKLIQADEVAREHFSKCLCEIDQMANIKFYLSHTYYSVLNMSNNIRKLATLTMNKEFVRNFEANLEKFPYYKNDLQSILQEAIQFRDESVIVRFRLSYTFKDLFPDIIIRKLSKNLTIKDVPLE